MSIRATTQRFAAWRGRQKVWWVTIAVFAIVIAYADGFWVTSLQGTVGAIERHAPPLHRWLRDSTLMLPLYFLAVLIALLMARRVVGQNRSKLVKFATTALLITMLTSGLAIAEVAASSAYDYHLQTSHLETEQVLHHTHPAATQAGSVAPSAAGPCTQLCASERDTFNTHVRAVLYGSVAMLITNLVLVLWVLALRSNRLWRRPNSSPVRVSSAAPKELSLV